MYGMERFPRRADAPFIAVTVQMEPEVWSYTPNSKRKIQYD